MEIVDVIASQSQTVATEDGFIFYRFTASKVN